MHTLNYVAMYIGYASLIACTLFFLLVLIRNINKQKGSTKDFYQGKHF